MAALGGFLVFRLPYPNGQKALPFGMAFAGFMPGTLEKMWRKPCAVSVFDDGIRQT